MPGALGAVRERMSGFHAGYDAKSKKTPALRSVRQRGLGRGERWAHTTSGGAAMRAEVSMRGMGGKEEGKEGALELAG